MSEERNVHEELKRSLDEAALRRAAPDRLTTPFDLFETTKYSRLSATELLRRYDGTIHYGGTAIRAELDEHGNLPTQVLERGKSFPGKTYPPREYVISRSTHDTEVRDPQDPDPIEPETYPERTIEITLGAPNELEPERRGIWLAHGWVPYGEREQKQLNAIVEQTKQHWQEWKDSGSKEDFRSWVGNKRVEAYKARQEQQSQ